MCSCVLSRYVGIYMCVRVCCLGTLVYTCVCSCVLSRYVGIYMRVCSCVLSRYVGIYMFVCVV